MFVKTESDDGPDSPPIPLLANPGGKKESVASGFKEVETVINVENGYHGTVVIESARPKPLVFETHQEALARPGDSVLDRETVVVLDGLLRAEKERNTLLKAKIDACAHALIHALGNLSNSSKTASADY